MEMLNPVMENQLFEMNTDGRQFYDLIRSLALENASMEHGQ